MFSNRKKFKMQGKTHAHKKALVKSMIIELIRAEKIKTTPSKAKVIKSSFDRLVTKAKSKTPASKTLISSFFSSDDRAVTRFYNIVEEKLMDRNSGYTRVIHTLPRKGDNAKQVYIMLVNTEAKEKKSRLQSILDRNEKKEEKKESKGGVISNLVGRRSTAAKVKEAKTLGKEKTAKTRRNSK